MADDVSKLQSEIAYLTGLINSHKHTDDHGSRYITGRTKEQSLQPRDRSQNVWIKQPKSLDVRREVPGKTCKTKSATNKIVNSTSSKHKTESTSFKHGAPTPGTSTDFQNQSTSFNQQARLIDSVKPQPRNLLAKVNDAEKRTVFLTSSKAAKSADLQNQNRKVLATSSLKANVSKPATSGKHTSSFGEDGHSILGKQNTEKSRTLHKVTTQPDSKEGVNKTITNRYKFVKQQLQTDHRKRTVLPVSAISSPEFKSQYCLVKYNKSQSKESLHFGDTSTATRSKESLGDTSTATRSKYRVDRKQCKDLDKTPVKAVKAVSSPAVQSASTSVLKKSRYKLTRKRKDIDQTPVKGAKPTSSSTGHSASTSVLRKSKYKLTRKCKDVDQTPIKGTKPTSLSTGHLASTSGLKNSRYKLTRKSTSTYSDRNPRTEVTSRHKLVHKTFSSSDRTLSSRFKILRNNSGSSVKPTKCSTSIVNKYKVVRRRSVQPSKSSCKPGNKRTLLNSSNFYSKNHWRSWNVKNIRTKYSKHRLVLPSRSRLVLDRRKSNTPCNRAGSSNRLVMIGGVAYYSTKAKLKRSSQPSVNPHNTSLVRNRHSSVTASDYNNKRVLASHALNKSIRIATSKQTKWKKGNYCLFYNRFGKCNRGDKCKYVHDPARVAVCTRFLRGRCQLENCPFSHNVTKEKMPVCSYFMRGVCNQDNCPYLHSNVAKDAAVCADFQQGFCSLGDKCKKKHTLVCPKLKSPGGCPDGTKCRLLHPKRKNGKQAQKRKASDELFVETAHDVGTVEVRSVVPNKHQKLSSDLPSFISLDESVHTETSTQTGASSDPIEIRPRFLMD